MEIKKVTLIYFSATGTTRKILESISQGMAVEYVTHCDLTLPESVRNAHPLFPEGLTIMGAPVYGGRLPAKAVNRFRQLKSSGGPVVLIVLYGNREFEDALLEFKHLSVELGFVPIAGGAFIGEHSFSTKGRPIANGRPDGPDIQKAKAFGVKIREKLGALAASGIHPDLEVPGKFPYEASGARIMDVSPVTLEDNCTLCGACAGLCPTAAISVNDTVTTKTPQCIRCCACIKNCPEHARLFQDLTMETITQWLNENCRTRKEPQMYGVNI